LLQTALQPRRGKLLDDDDGTGGEIRTPADTVLETVALPLSYAGKRKNEMSTQGNIAIEGYIDDLKKFLDQIKDRPPEEQLRLLTKQLEDDKNTADAGWY
jgi:hypothetical protein